METISLLKFWPSIHGALLEIWSITEPQIEDAAIRYNIPIELYYYAEFGLDYFSVELFQERDPFSNPEQFERQFARLDVKDWIRSVNDGKYQVTERARESVRRIVQAGDDCLVKFESTADVDLERLLAFLKQLILANNAASEPPEKLAIANRFRVATGQSPMIVQIRECLMDLFAYRDDSYLAAARPYFNQAGLVWSAFGAVCNGTANTAEKIAEVLPLRGYEIDDYAAALQAAVEVGWLEQGNLPDAFYPTSNGREMREQVEKLTDEYFYHPWTMFSPTDLDEFYELLVKLREQLHDFKRLL